ncbi:cytochrome c-type biogenesis protein [Kordiimonas laminariae]|uniref:cytochrome c-type biogenesis protein n=1 Tax=Kordiimonas laminariae TaxID=2917717 RepID=UPI001FF3BD9E|nr:cytochrome c-type biogenesis protein [Kordiimonas laminariae]MCK0069993.1 cytochrome c-type biogenesis protein CcmH [Kordiimonas laminariae]
MLRWFGSILIVVTLSITVFAVAVDDKPLKDPVKEAMARALMKEIRCLVCQNQSIEDSNADLARDLRQIVRERISLGDSPDNVRAYLVDRYGDWVLLEPPVNTSTYLLWGSPFLLLLLVAYGVMRSRREQAGPAPLSSEEQEKLNAILREGDGK